jgi:hypothetical protein
MRLRLLCVSRVEECTVGRVVFGKNAEPGKWFRLDSLLQDIAAHQPSDPSNVPSGPSIDLQDPVSDRSAAVGPSSQLNVLQSATAATASSQGARMAARHEGAFIDSSTSDFEAGDAPHHAEILSMSAAFAR